MSIICVHSKCSMLPDQRVGCCSCTCRESTRACFCIGATTIFLLCAFWHIGKNLLCKMLCLARSLFCCPKQSFSVCVQQEVVFHDLHHYMFIDPFVHAHVNAISDPHTHTLTHTLMKHTMHHTLHTQIHMIYAIAQHA